MSRQNPTDVEDWFRRINEQLDQASRMWGGDTERWRPSEAKADVDVIDRGDEYVVTMDLPGYTNESVSASLSDRTLFVEARREGVEETETEGEETYVRMERSHETVSRRVRLPEPVDADDASARMNNGVLTITLAKETPGSGSQSIDIE